MTRHREPPPDPANSEQPADRVELEPWPGSHHEGTAGLIVAVVHYLPEGDGLAEVGYRAFIDPEANHPPEMLDAFLEWARERFRRLSATGDFHADGWQRRESDGHYQLYGGIVECFPLDPFA